MAGGAADGRVEGVMRAGCAALGTVEEARCPAGMGHGLKEEAVEDAGGRLVLEVAEDGDDGLVEVGVGIEGEFFGGLEGGAGGGVALVVVDDVRAIVAHGVCLGDGVEAAALVELHVEVDEVLEARAEAGLGAAHALGDAAHEPVVVREQHDNAVGLAEVVRADDDGAVPEVGTAAAAFRTRGTSARACGLRSQGVPGIWGRTASSSGP